MNIEPCPTYEIDQRKREIQLLINIVQPDPEYQPTFISDAASFLDISGLSNIEVESKLEFYFKGELPAPLNTLLWVFVDMVKSKYPSWPEDWPPNN